MIGGSRYLLVPSLSKDVLIFSVVLLIPCFCLFMFPLSIAGAYSGRYFWTAHAVNPGHADNCLLLIAFTSVCLYGINAACCRYLMSADLDVMEYALYDMCLVWPVCVSGDVLLYS